MKIEQLNFLPRIDRLKISQKYITIFASGNSILDINDRHLKGLFSKTFVFTMNYGFEYFIKKGLCPDVNIHSDTRVTEYIATWMQKNPKSFKVLTRREAFDKHNIVHLSIADYMFVSTEFGRGNYTLTYLINLLQHYYPDKTILLFGFDCEVTKPSQKFYDTYTDFDKNKRGQKYPTMSRVLQCEKELVKYRDKNIINCNINSKSPVFKKELIQNILDKILGET